MEANKYINLFDNKPLSKMIRDEFNTQLFEDFHKLLLLTCYTRGFNKEESKDVVIDFFLKDILPEKQFKHFYKISTSADGNLPGYIYRSFKNHCTKELKKKNKEIIPSSKFIELNCMPLKNYTQNSETKIIIDRVLSVLPDRQKLVVYFWIYGYSYKEIVEIIGVKESVKDKPNAIKQTFFRAIATLKEIFGGDDNLRFLLSN